MDDQDVISAQIATEGFGRILVPGAFLVEFFPMLRYIPNWVPGTVFKKVAEEYLPYVTRMREKPYADVKAAVVSDEQRPAAYTVLN